MEIERVKREQIFGAYVHGVNQTRKDEVTEGEKKENMMNQRRREKRLKGRIETQKMKNEKQKNNENKCFRKKNMQNNLEEKFVSGGFWVI